MAAFALDQGGIGFLVDLMFPDGNEPGLGSWLPLMAENDRESGFGVHDMPLGLLSRPKTVRQVGSNCLRGAVD